MNKTEFQASKIKSNINPASKFEEDFNKLFGHVISTCSSAEPEWLTAPWPFPKKEVFYENPRNSIKRFRLLKDHAEIVPKKSAAELAKDYTEEELRQGVKLDDGSYLVRKPLTSPIRILSDRVDGMSPMFAEKYVRDIKAKGSAGFDEPQRRETDPHGKNPNSPGAKVDAGKTKAWLFMAGFSRALKEVAKVTTVGASKYTPNGWVTVPDGEERYMDAAMRHLLAYGAGEKLDDGEGGTGCLHLSQVVWNLLAVLELELRNEKP